MGRVAALAPVVALFFTWGFITSAIDPLIPAVRAIFQLNYAQSMLTQFAFFMAYLVISLPAAWALQKFGSLAAVMGALAAMVAGCLVMPLATSVSSYWGVLGGLFIIAGGITLLQVAANPLAAGLGAAESAPMRLTLCQAINSFGTVLGPYFATRMLLGDISLHAIDRAFLLIAALILALLGFVWRARGRLVLPQMAGAEGASVWPAFQSGWALAGAFAIFLYVGAEVSVGSVMINFLHQPAILGVSLAAAGNLLVQYWLGAMIGRFVGSAILGFSKMPAARLLAGAAVGAAFLCLVVTQTEGALAARAALSIGLMNSIMFPTIFTLTLARSCAPRAATSGLLCMAIVGGAVLPLLVGRIADVGGLRVAYFVPCVAYGLIAGFAVAAGRGVGRPELHGRDAGYGG